MKYMKNGEDAGVDVIVGKRRKFLMICHSITVTFLEGRTSYKEVHFKPICIYDCIVGVCRATKIDLNSLYF